MPNFLNNNDAQTVKTSSTGFTLTNSATREPRRRAKSNILDDPLGLLGTTSKPTEEIVQQVQPKVDVKKSVNALPQDDLPEWLSGTKRTTNSEKLDDKINNKEAEVSNLTSTFDVKNNTNDKNTKDKCNNNLSLLTETQLEQQASIVALHQQEHELRTAKILTEQSDQLNSIVSTQKAKIEEQEKMLNTLVKSQVERQANLDTQIKMQQAKIDHFIQALSRQPSLPVIFKNENDGNDNIEDNIHHENKNIETESMINKLKNDTELLENNYETKIEKLINEKKQLEDYYKLQIETLKTDHAEYVKEIYNRHLEQIKLLQNEHSNMMENICRSKELERQTVDFIQDKKNDLDNVLKQSQLIFNNIQTFSDKLNNKDQQITDKQNDALKKEEEYLQEMKENLKNQQDSMEKERRQLIIAAEKIETQSLKLSSEYKKNSDIQDDIESRLKIREKDLLREKELFLEQSKWERKHIQYMKETWTIEQKRQMQMIADEREKLHAEKAKFEVLNNLKCNSDDITKAELESALNTARQVAKEANAEREKWQERVASLDIEKKRIQIKEKSLTDKARELENLTQSAISKRDEGLKALKDAHYLEKQQTDKMSIQLEMLAQRENKIATDKLSLARDRLIMKTSQREKPEKDMTSNYHYSKYENDEKHESQIQTHFSDIVDPKLILLKLNLDNNLSTSNQLLSDMQITN
ncbi:trichohyalin-like [Aphidius gifuensis]|uniref:trichohyalin-like n=1 Tax=Aphidius gifuensis TaxID=684658 RepID=UPI001CDD5463|nr:trichohyalin-like [Aphidius gifuensis]